MADLPSRIAVTGASGLIGSRLCAHLRQRGATVLELVRRTANPAKHEVEWDPAGGTIDAAGLAGVEAVVHLAGAGIGDRRWSDGHRKAILRSRVDGTTLLANALADLSPKPAVLLSGSAIGIYGQDRGDEILTEASPAGPKNEFLVDVCDRWEKSTAAAEVAGIRVCHLRTGIVQDPSGGQLAKTLPLFKIGLGGKFGSGEQYWSWIAPDDHIRAMAHLMTSDVSGPVNLTAPNPLRQEEYTEVLARVLGRPSFATVPAFGPRLLLGREMADNLLFASQRVQPTVLEADGFTFSHPDLESTLRHELGK